MNKTQKPGSLGRRVRRFQRGGAVSAGLNGVQTRQRNARNAVQVSWSAVLGDSVALSYPICTDTHQTATVLLAVTSSGLALESFGAVMAGGTLGELVAMSDGSTRYGTNRRTPKFTHPANET